MGKVDREGMCRVSGKVSVIFTIFGPFLAVLGYFGPLQGTGGAEKCLFVGPKWCIRGLRLTAWAQKLNFSQLMAVGSE